MAKKPEPVLTQLDPKDRTLAERTLDALSALIKEPIDLQDMMDRDEAIEILNLAFLESTCSGTLHGVRAWQLSGLEPRFFASRTPGGKEELFPGKPPEPNTVYTSVTGERLFVKGV